MAARYSRRQAARVAGLLTKSFFAGLTFLEGRPRSGRTDFLLQLFDGLRESAGPKPVFLSLGGRPAAASELAAQAVAQLLAFEERRLSSPLVIFDRARVLERPDFEAWQPLLAAAEGALSPARFLAAVGLFAAQRGPVCLLLDDAPPALLEAAAALPSPDIAVIASGHPHPPAGARLLPLEPFSAREALLLAESLARSLQVRFSGSAAEPFIACIGADAFVLDAVVRSAALHGEALDSANAFIRTYRRDATGGTLAAFFAQRVPGRPGSPARRLALELLAAAGRDAPRDWLVEESWLARWRPRAPVDEVLEAFAELGWAHAGAHGWLLRASPAASHWALLQTLAPLSARGVLTVRLVSEMRAAAARTAAAGRRSHIEKLLRALTPDAVARLASDSHSPLRALEVCEVAAVELPDADLFLCFGLTQGAQAAVHDPALLAVALLAEGADLKQLLPRLEEHVGAAAAGGRCLEKWLVFEEETDLAKFARLSEGFGGHGPPGWKAIPFDHFNELVAGAQGATAVNGAGELVLSLPAEPEIELAAVRLLEHLAERGNWDEGFVSQARMALVEACLNAVAQARGQVSSARRRIEVRLAADGHELRMSVSNSGAPFDPGEEQGAALGSALNRGHGLKIIRSFVDEVRFFADLKGTRIEMRKRRGPPGAAAANEMPPESGGR